VIFQNRKRDWNIVASIIQVKSGWSHKRPPDVEIRKNSTSGSLETWFHMQTGEGITVCCFSANDMPKVLADWSDFTGQLERHSHLIVVKDFYNWLLGDVLASSKSWKDTAGNVMPPVIYFKHSFSENCSVRIGRFAWSISLPAFRTWLDQIIELHRHYLPPQPK
jgi:hypothetical protein